MRWLRVLYAFQRCCPCFLFLALCTLFRFFLDFSHFSFFRRPSVTVFLSSQVIFVFVFDFRFVVFFIYFLVTIILFFLNLLPCPADHEPDWQPRAVFFLFFLFVNMVGARSVNVMNTTTTTYFNHAGNHRVSIISNFSSQSQLLKISYPSYVQGAKQ